MTHHHQKVAMRDEDHPGTKFEKPYFITITKRWAVILAVIFLAAIVVTSLLTHFLTSCPQNASKSPLIIYDNIKLDTTTVTTTTTQQKSVPICPNEKVTVTTPKTETKDEPKNLRLPKAIHPISYEIQLTPFIFEGNFTFNGQVTIAINVTETCKNVTLHALDLTVGDVTIRTSDFLYVNVGVVTNDTKRQFLIIHLDSELTAGQIYYVTVTYKGVLNDLLQGFYRSSYKVNNQTRWIAATQFQATDARRAFPCFDEPAFKATFRLNVARPKNMTSISNMPKLKRKKTEVPNLPDYEWDHFAESLPMSTYLVAFVVSDFESITHGNFSIWARKSALSQAKYSLEIGPKVLKFYEQFFGIAYPLPKIDMIALPDFSAGAMENWGLITYRESVLLYEEKVSSRKSKQRIAHVIAHELAHQWFGNLVTPDWWSDLWLNEGFATYMETLAAEAIYPDWKESDQFLVNELHEALQLDALKSSHQISVGVNNPDEINDIFDQISYSKGAAILRMMQNFLTMPVFRDGLTRYLKSRMYGNANQDDLWATFTNISHEKHLLQPNVTIKDVMDTWTIQTGFPLVEIIRNYTSNQATIKQTRFFVDGPDGKDTCLWYIPITYVDNTGKITSLWLNRQQEITVELANQEWVLFNVNQTGYYRVNYDAVAWQRLTKQLLTNHRQFDAKNRAQIIDDSLSLALGGYLDYETALNVTTYLKKEREYVPWKAALSNLNFIYGMTIGSEHFDTFRNYLIELIDGFYKDLGFFEKSTDSQLDVYSRVNIYYWACKLGVRDCISNAVKQFLDWRNSHNPDKLNSIPENLRHIIYCTAISIGGQEEWDFAWQRYLNANVENEKEILLLSLGCSKEPWILTRYLKWSISDNTGIRKHESARVFSAVAGNSIGQNLAYKFLKTNWNKIRNHLGTSSMALSALLRSCTSKFNTESDVEDLKLFLKKHEDDLGIVSRTAKQAIEQGMANVKWMSKNYENIIKWLAKT